MEGRLPQHVLAHPSPETTVDVVVEVDVDAPPQVTVGRSQVVLHAFPKPDVCPWPTVTVEVHTTLQLLTVRVEQADENDFVCLESVVDEVFAPESDDLDVVCGAHGSLAGSYISNASVILPTSSSSDETPSMTPLTSCVRILETLSATWVTA